MKVIEILPLLHITDCGNNISAMDIDANKSVDIYNDVEKYGKYIVTEYNYIVDEYDKILYVLKIRKPRPFYLVSSDTIERYCTEPNIGKTISELLNKCGEDLPIQVEITDKTI